MNNLNEELSRIKKAVESIEKNLQNLDSAESNLERAVEMGIGEDFDLEFHYGQKSLEQAAKAVADIAFKASELAERIPALSSRFEKHRDDILHIFSAQ